MAVFVYWAMFLGGETTVVPVVGDVEVGSAAEQAAGSGVAGVPVAIDQQVDASQAGIAVVPLETEKAAAHRSFERQNLS